MSTQTQGHSIYRASIASRDKKRLQPSSSSFRTVNSGKRDQNKTLTTSDVNGATILPQRPANDVMPKAWFLYIIWLSITYRAFPSPIYTMPFSPVPIHIIKSFRLQHVFRLVWHIWTICLSFHDAQKKMAAVESAFRNQPISIMLRVVCVCAQKIGSV